MKRTFALVALVFPLVCSAQTLRWEKSIPIPSPASVSVSSVVSDGAGGGAVLLEIDPSGENSFARVVWFDSTGKTILSRDLETASDTGVETEFTIARVTTAALHLHAEVDPPEAAPSIVLHKFSKKEGEPVSSQLAADETLSFPAPLIDKRGFFTTQRGSTNVVVRRYTF